MKNEKIGILGYGEVGRAVSKFYKNPRIKDLKRDDNLKGVDILNVCIPWGKNFVKIVKQEIKSIKPKLTIIHSTVAPGTTRKIGGSVVHSPVRGIHPNLFLGIKTFVKYIGADDKKSGNLARKHLESLGIKTEIVMPSLTTEVAKLLDTSYYGLCIAWHGEIDKTATDFNKTYNDGYLKLGNKNVIRPVLYYPRGKIGGHCVVPNALILRKLFRSEAFNLILKYDGKRN